MEAFEHTWAVVVVAVGLGLGALTVILRAAAGGR